MVSLLCAFTLLYVLFNLYFFYGWKQIPTTTSEESAISFSVVIPVRNEEKTIEKILKKLSIQHYPKNLYEVIIVDDFSDDSTSSILSELSKELDITIRIIKLDDPQKTGKKHALTAGVEAAKYETIITTDADCWFGKGWLTAFSRSFKPHINIVAGPVNLRGKGLFGKLQQLEFAGLIGFGAVTISKENPSMCSGANMGFKKAAFEAVGGYANNLFTPSGDDEFLLFNIMKKFPHTACFMKSQEGVVNTSAHTTLGSFLNQRIRWTSKWKYNKNWRMRVGAVLFFMDSLLFVWLILGVLYGVYSITLLAVIVLVRYLGNAIYISPINKFLQGIYGFLELLLFQIIYPFHVLFMGMNSIFGSYTWKGRKYR